MKTINALLSILALSSVAASAQLASDNAAPAIAPSPVTPPTLVADYTPVERGPHHAVWQRVMARSLPSGTLLYETNSFTQLQTGLHHVVSNQWVLSSAQISLAPSGGAATNTAHQVLFAANANTADALRLTTPEGKTLTSHVLCLSYFSPASGSNVVIAGLQDSIGQIVPPYDQVLYTNALGGEGWAADLLYKNSTAGLEQNVVVRQQLPPPSKYDLGAEGGPIMLQVWSELVSPPTPNIIASQVAIEAPATDGSPGQTWLFDDCELDFGLMKIGPGKAFSIGDPADTSQAVWVLKQWVVINFRTFLVEQIPLEAIASQLQALPPQASVSRTNTSGFATLRGRQPASLAPPVSFARSENRSMSLAKLDPRSRPGVVIDWSLLQSTNSYTLKSDTTYYLSGVANIGTLTIEGGTVVKLANTNTPSIVSTNVICKTAPYRMAVFTAKDDTSIGDTIGTNTIFSTNYYGSIALDLSTAGSGVVLSNLQFHYLSNALAGTGIKLRNSQIVQCQTGFASGSRQASLYNVLLYLLNRVVNQNASVGDTITAQNVTAHYCTNFTFDTTGTINLTNCLFVSVTNWQCTHTYTNSSAFVYSDAVFQTVGAAGHYLADNTYRNGTTNIDATLLAELKTKTTFPPIVYTLQTMTGNRLLAPQAQRGIISLGYAYDPIDFAFQQVYITNAVVWIGPGTAIAAGGLYGLALHAGATLIGQGSPTSLVHMVRYNMVQERSTNIWDGIGPSIYGDYWGGVPTARATFAFTDWSMPAQDAAHFLSQIYPMVNSFSHCQFHGGRLYNYVGALSLTNNLFERVQTIIDDSSGIFSYSPTVRNCLFFGGNLILYHWYSGTWTFRDNLFDRTAISQNGPLDHDYDAYTAGSNRLTNNGPHDLLITNADYQAGTLGNYYYPTNGTNLFLLIDAGSTWATNVGLYHFCTTTNQAKEAGTKVDAGFHWIALDANGAPVDSDGGGVADFLEDRNGNGSVDAGETDWHSGHGSDDSNYQLSPGYLRCEYRVDPWGVTTNYGLPRLYWVVSSAQRAAKQVAYEILVASSAANASNSVADVWDSGKQYSDQTIHVEYKGPPLQSGQRLWWKVRSWDLYSGFVSLWSTNGFFQMGLLSTNDWGGAKWIGMGTSAYKSANPCPMFRSTNNVLSKQIANATAYVSAKGVYELWINGYRIGPNVLAPEWTDYNQRIQYQTFDVAPYLTNGTPYSSNIIGAFVAEGWCYGKTDYGTPPYYGDKNPQFVLRLVITNTDGTTLTLQTDQNWRCSTNGPIRSASIYDGETYDSNQEGAATNWTLASYAALYFTNAISTATVDNLKMFSQPNDPIQVTDTVQPRASWTISSNSTQVVKVYDLGQEIVGWCNIFMTNVANMTGTNVILRHAEVLQLDANNNVIPQGGIYVDNLRGAAQTDTYILNNDPVQRFHPRFTYHSFRYVEITAPPSVIANLTMSGSVNLSAVPFTGAFCSYGANAADTNANWVLTNGLLNKLMTNAFWGLRGNLQSVLTSCGGRAEREGYFYDEHIFSQTACFTADMSAFLTKWIRDMRDAQITRTDRGYTVYAPWDNQPLVGSTYGDPGAQAGGLVFPWRLYQNYADTRMLVEHYSSASNWFGYLTNTCLASDGSWRTSVWGDPNTKVSDWQEGDQLQWFGDIVAHPSDWFINHNSPDPSASVGYYTWGTAWSAYSADTLATMSQILQQQAIDRNDAASANTYAANFSYYTNMATKIRTAYTNSLVQYDGSGAITAFISASTATFPSPSTSQGDTLSALIFNMIPDTQRSQLLTNVLVGGHWGISNYNKYCSDGSKGSNHVSTGYYFSSREMLELTRDGFTTNAYKIVMDTNFPSWLYPVVNGATTCWESWSTYLSGPGTGRGYRTGSGLDSFNHLPFGAISEWIWKVIGGINPDDANPGFKNVVIMPEPGGGVTNALASFASIRGPILTSWTNNAGSHLFSLTVAVPANASASIYVPYTGNLADITENALINGQAATTAPGIISYYVTNLLNFTNGAAVFQVGSGLYSLAVTNHY